MTLKEAKMPNYWLKLWQHRELLLFLAWRDILVRYKQTLLGVSWALLRPVLTMLIFAIVFGKFLNLSGEGMPYVLLVYVGTLTWILFASALSDCSQSLSTNSHLITKVYFPRLIIPSSALLVACVDYVIACLPLIGMLIYYSIQPTWRIIFFPLFTGLVLITAFGLGTWLAALNVRYRDFKHIIPFVLQLGVYASPVGYSTQLIPAEWRFLYSLNPMVGIIDGLRWSLSSRDDQVYWPSIIISIVVGSIFLILGLRYFRKNESTFADTI
jgi:lipopolysaccharide transport system permease protein